MPTKLKMTLVEEIKELETEGFAKAANRRLPLLDALVNRRTKSKAVASRLELLNMAMSSERLILSDEAQEAYRLVLGLDDPSDDRSATQRTGSAAILLSVSTRTLGRNRKTWRVLLADVICDLVSETAPVVRMPRADLVLGRQDELDALSDELPSLDADAVPSVVAITGPPGIGKTTLAAAWASQNGYLFDVRYLINASNAEVLGNDLSRLRRDLSHVQSGSTGLNQLLGSVGPWFLIFDGATKPRLLEPILESLTGGLIVVTSSYERWGKLTTRHLPLRPLERKESMKILLSGSLTLDQAPAKRVADLVGDHPGALGKIADLARTGQRTLAELADVLTDRLADVLDLPAAPFERRYYEPYRLLVEELETFCPLAIPAARILTMFQAICSPRALELFGTLDEQNIAPDAPEILFALVDPVKRLEIASALREYGVIQFTDDNQGLGAVHSLMTRALGDSTAELLLFVAVYAEFAGQAAQVLQGSPLSLKDSKDAYDRFTARALANARPLPPDGYVRLYRDDDSFWISDSLAIEYSARAMALLLRHFDMYDPEVLFDFDLESQTDIDLVLMRNAFFAVEVAAAVERNPELHGGSELFMSQLQTLNLLGDEHLTEFRPFDELKREAKGVLAKASRLEYVDLPFEFEPIDNMSIL